MRDSGKVASAISAYGGVTTSSASTNRLERTNVMRRGSWREVLGERRQVLEHRGAGRQLAFLLRLLPLAGEHQHRLRAGGGRRLQVAARVADHVDVVERDVEAAGDLEQHAGLRLPAFAGRVGGVRTEEERVDAPADLRQGALQVVV